MRLPSSPCLQVALLILTVAACSATDRGPGGIAPESGGAGGSVGATAGSGGGETGGTNGGMTAGCTPGQMTASGELLGRYGSLKTMAADKEYFLQVNEWGASATQRMAYGGDFFFKMTDQQASRATDMGPTGFPSLFIGANAGHATAGSNLPKQVSALTAVPTTWNWKDNGTLTNTATNSYNATYDVWFSTQPQGEPAASNPSGGFLMVWLYDPPDAQPIGRALYSAITVPGIAGTWDVWIGTNGARPCTSYVRTERTPSMSFDLNAFIKDAVSNRRDASGQPTIQDSWYLTNVFIGFEIWRGGIGLETTNFCAVVD